MERKFRRGGAFVLGLSISGPGFAEVPCQQARVFKLTGLE